MPLDEQLMVPTDDGLVLLVPSGARNTTGDVGESDSAEVIDNDFAAARVVGEVIGG